MEKNVLLILGASSECGIALIEKVIDRYDLVYAHYGHQQDNLVSLEKQYGEKLVLIKDDFSVEEAGYKVLKTIEEKDIYPNHVVHFPAPPYENIKFHKSSWKDFEIGINTSLRSIVVILEKVVGTIIKEKKEGRVVFMLSSYVEHIPPKYSAPYVTIKYALLGLMRELSAEYADKNIMVNGISPSMMETKFLKNVPELIIQKNASESPFGRNLYVSEVIPAIEFLLSEGASKITGQNIVISGGIA